MTEGSGRSHHAAKGARPACYFAEGDARILLSPASVDLGGVFITPRGEDFEKISAEDIRQYSEVCLDEDELKTLQKKYYDRKK
jgi:hypothetical protein